MWYIVVVWHNYMIYHGKFVNMPTQTNVAEWGCFAMAWVCVLESSRKCWTRLSTVTQQHMLEWHFSESKRKYFELPDSGDAWVGRRCHGRQYQVPPLSSWVTLIRKLGSKLPSHALLKHFAAGAWAQPCWSWGLSWRESSPVPPLYGLDTMSCENVVVSMRTGPCLRKARGLSSDTLQELGSDSATRRGRLWRSGLPAPSFLLPWLPCRPSSATSRASA